MVAEPNPITLRVSHESRALTLDNYKILLEISNEFKHYYNPAIDRVVLCICYPIWKEREAGDLEEDGSEWKGGDTARFVEVAMWSPQQVMSQLIVGEEYPDDVEGNTRTFPKLEHIQFRLDFRYYQNELEDLNILRQSYEYLERLFGGEPESRKEDFKMPEIIIVGFPRP